MNLYRNEHDNDTKFLLNINRVPPYLQNDSDMELSSKDA